MQSFGFEIWVMVFNATFNNISVITWQSVLLVEETIVPDENHWPGASHWQTLSHNLVSSTPRQSRVQTHNVSGDRHWLHRVVINPTTIRSRPQWLHNLLAFSTFEYGYVFFSATLWQENYYFWWDDDDVFFFYQTNMLTWIFVNVSSLKQQYTGWHSDTFSWLWANQSLLALLNAVYRVEKKNSNLKVFGLTQLGIKPMIYHTEGKNTGQTNDLPYWRQECRSNPRSTILKARMQVKPMIYHTEGKNAGQTHDLSYWRQECRSNPWSTTLKARMQVKPTIYHTEGKNTGQTHDLRYWRQECRLLHHWSSTLLTRYKYKQISLMFILDLDLSFCVWICLIFSSL